MGVLFRPNWIVDLLFLASQRYLFALFTWYKIWFLKLFIKYIHVAFGERWGPQICELHLTFLKPWIYEMVIVWM
jgi:hypothetical protein